MGRAGLLFVGGGGHAVVVAEAARSQRAGVEAMGCVDDAEHPALSLPPMSVRRLGPLASVGEHAGGSTAWVLALGDVGVRRRVLNGLPGGLGPAWTVVHERAFTSPSASVGLGAFVGPGALVHALARVGQHAIINSGAIVEHHAEVGENAHVAPGAVIGGACVVGRDVLVGLGARVLPGVRLGEGCVVGAGAVVLEDVAAGARVVGVPARATRG